MGLVRVLHTQALIDEGVEVGVGAGGAVEAAEGDGVRELVAERESLLRRQLGEEEGNRVARRRAQSDRVRCRFLWLGMNEKSQEQDLVWLMEAGIRRCRPWPERSPTRSILLDLNIVANT